MPKRRRFIAHHRNTRGFTLVEMIVSMGLFIVVFVIASSAMVSVHAVSRQVQNTTDIVDSMSFIFNDIVNSARLSTQFSCSPSDPPSTDDCNGDTFSFITKLPDGSDGSEITYRFQGGVVEKSINDGIYAQMTPSELEIESLQFHIFDALPGDAKPGRVLITMNGVYGKDSKDEVSYDLQTTVTQRIVE